MFITGVYQGTLFSMSNHVLKTRRRIAKMAWMIDSTERTLHDHENSETIDFTAQFVSDSKALSESFQKMCNEDLNLRKKSAKDDFFQNLG